MLDQTRLRLKTFKNLSVLRKIVELNHINSKDL